MKLLAVSIPTFKRPELLRQCLEALATQCESQAVDIHVFDDSCSDINRPLYRELKSHCSRLHVHFNLSNLGIDRNIDQCINVPDARYVWIIGEDDLAVPGAVTAILEALQRHQPSFLFLNYQYISNDHHTLLNVAVPDIVPGSVSAGEFFRLHGWATGFLGANVVNKKFWDAGCQDYMNTYFNHVGKIFSHLDPESNIEIISKPMVLNRAESLNSFSWLNDAFEVNAGFGEMLSILSKNHPKWAFAAHGARSCFYKKIDFSKLRTLLVLRALGIYNLTKYKKFMRSRPLSWLYASIAIAPITPLYWLYKQVTARK